MQPPLTYRHCYLVLNHFSLSIHIRIISPHIWCGRGSERAEPIHITGEKMLDVISTMTSRQITFIARLEMCSRKVRQKKSRGASSNA